MFSARVKPWHGIGTVVEECPSSGESIRLAGLDWNVEQQDVYTGGGTLVPGYKANVRDYDQNILGVVSDRYQVVQNWEAFAFTDGGIRYETAGALQGGRRTFLLARLPQRFIIAGDEIAPYFVIMARETLQFAEQYMREMGKGVDELAHKKLTDKKVMEYMSEFFPVSEGMTAAQKKNNITLLNDMKARYFDAPDLQGMGKNGYRFINAVSDFATHAEPIRRTKNYRENLFLKTVEGNPMIDRAYQMVCAA